MINDLSDSYSFLSLFVRDGVVIFSNSIVVKLGKKEAFTIRFWKDHRIDLSDDG